MRTIIYSLIILLFPLSLVSQDISVSIIHLAGGCDGPDSLTTTVSSIETTIAGGYNYMTYNHFCTDAADTLSGMVSIDEITGPVDNIFRFSDFSFGLWEACYGIDPPTGSLQFSYENNLVGNLTGADNYGDTWSFDSFVKMGNSYNIVFSNTYGEFGTTNIVPDDGRELPPIDGQTITYTYLWSTGETTPSIEVTDQGLYSVTVTDNNGNTGSSSFELEFANSFPDVPALISIYNAMGGENWTNREGWRQAAEGTQICDPCTWDGVRCFGGPRVNWLDLRDNNLTGTIPDEIGGLGELRAINLDGNLLTGSIPSGLQNLTRLSRLNLSDNMLSGSVPEFFKDMQSLININLSENQLTGSIPAGLGQMENLEELDLNSNQVTGNIPEELGDASLLQSIILFNNQIEGEIPQSIGELSMLEGLYLSFNQLQGNIPSSLGTAEFLSEVYLDNNNLEGPLPEGLFNNTAIRRLFLHNNNLSGCYPEVSEQLCAIGQAMNPFIIEINGEEVEVYFEDGFNMRNNPLLPWEGDFERHCNGEDQIGAPCDAGNKSNVADVINMDCECAEDDGTATYDLDGVVISIFPNPVTAELVVEIDDSKDVVAKLYYINGKEACDIELNRRTDLSEFPEGAYVLIIEKDNQILITETVIKQ
ncbi:MAG: T9SS type A sorting domain-containing protein [Saprospiraceae bacterium]|nr:T9SS type A sorting domain-containing protein [Saprospiraceae bacterium]